MILIQNYLFSNTDNYIKADGSVKASFRKAHENLEKKYRGREIGGKVVEAIDFNQIQAEFRENNTNDVYGDGVSANVNPNELAPPEAQKKNWDPNTQVVRP